MSEFSFVYVVTTSLKITRHDQILVKSCKSYVNQCTSLRFNRQQEVCVTR